VGFWSRCTAMPRTSPLPIHLSVAEAAELRRRSTKYTLPYFQVQRAKMILMAAEGWENNEIAARLGTRRDVVSEWRKRFLIGIGAAVARRPLPHHRAYGSVHGGSSRLR
jgi:Homeodomain-like domain